MQKQQNSCYLTFGQQTKTNLSPMQQQSSQKEPTCTPKFNKNREFRSKSTMAYYEAKLNSNLEPDSVEISSIFEEAKEFIKGVDQKISNFKKFNENKVYQRYQYMISTMQKQISFLRTRLKYEENNRTPTKEYMKNLLDQLVALKKENQKLKQEIKESKQTIKNQQKDIQKSKQGIYNLQISLKNKIQRLPSLNYNGNVISQLISKFMQQKQQIRNLLSLATGESKLQKYLKQIQKQKPSWDILKFIIEIDKWVENQCHKNPQVDTWKIRYGISDRFNRIRGQSMTPTPRDQKPNRYQKSKAKKLKQVGLPNFSSRKLSSSQKIY